MTRAAQATQHQDPESDVRIATVLGKRRGVRADDAQQIRAELKRLGIDPDKTSGLRVRESQYDGYVKLAVSSVPAEEMEVDAAQVKAKLASLSDGAGRDAALHAIGFPRNLGSRRR